MTSQSLTSAFRAGRSVRFSLIKSRVVRHVSAILVRCWTTIYFMQAKVHTIKNKVATFIVQFCQEKSSLRLVYTVAQ